MTNTVFYVSKLTQQAKTMLKEQAHEMYILRAEDLEVEEIPGHYFNLGWLIKKIEKYDNMEDIIRDVKYGEFETIGYFRDNDRIPAVETFLTALYQYLNL